MLLTDVYILIDHYSGHETRTLKWVELSAREQLAQFAQHIIIQICILKVFFSLDCSRYQLELYLSFFFVESGIL